MNLPVSSEERVCIVLNEQTAKKNLVANLVLRYFNRYLRDRGMITESEYIRMIHKIQSRYPDHIPGRT